MESHMTRILREKYELREKELMNKYVSRMRGRRKRVKATEWITVHKLPPGFLSKRRKPPPKIDDEEEVDTAVSSLEMINQGSSISTIPMASNVSPLRKNVPPTVLNDADLTDCFNFSQTNHQIVSIDDQQKQQQQFFSSALPTAMEYDILGSLIKATLPPGMTNIELGPFQVGVFTMESPDQESILSSSSPFPTSPSMSSSSPQQIVHDPGEQKVIDDFVSSINSIQSPLVKPIISTSDDVNSPPSVLLSEPELPLPPTLATESFTSPQNSSSSSSPPPLPALPIETPLVSTQSIPLPPSLPPPPQVSHGKDLFLLFHEAQNASESESSDDEYE